MSSSRTKILGVAGAALGLFCAGRAVAAIMAFRQPASTCVAVPLSSGALKQVGPTDGPGLDWGIVNTSTSLDLVVQCPLTLNVSTSNTALSQPLIGVQVLYAANPGKDVKCVFNLVDNAGGGAWSSGDMAGTPSGMTSNIFQTQSPTGTVQLANSFQSRAFFTCTLPKSSVVAGGGVANAILKAFEVRYGQ
jgi:hypothetical protein